MNSRKSRASRHLPYRFGISCCALLGLWRCDDSEGTQPFLSLRELDAAEQPTLTSLGVLVAVSARGADAVRFDVSGGSLEFLGSDAATPVCVATRVGGAGNPLRSCARMSDSGPVSFVVAVHPSGQEEALVSASLGNIAGAAAGGDGGAASAQTALSASAPCDSVPFESLGVYSAMVVSLGRAPAPAPSGGAPGSGGRASSGGMGIGGEAPIIGGAAGSSGAPPVGGGGAGGEMAELGGSAPQPTGGESGSAGGS